MFLDYFYSGLFVLLCSAFVFWQIDLSRKREGEAYSRIIDSLITDKQSSLDRLFMSKGLPPTGVDVRAEREERMQKQKEKVERVEGLPVAHNAVDRARADAIAAEQRDLKKGAQQ